MPEEKEKVEAPTCCEECLKWQQFGKNCWVYWERKSHCTQKVTENDL